MIMDGESHETMLLLEKRNLTEAYMQQNQPTNQLNDSQTIQFNKVYWTGLSSFKKCTFVSW